jgi:hypothetical protein
VKRHWPAIVVIALVALLGLVGFFAPDDSTAEAATWLFGIASAALALAQYLAQRVEASRFALLRLRRQVLNEDVSLGLVLEADLPERPRLQSVARRLQMATSQPVDVLGAGPDAGLLVLNGVSFQLQLSAAGTQDDFWKLRLELPPSTRSFRSWSRAVDGWLFKVIDDWYRALEPLRERITVAVQYGSTNPYFEMPLDQVEQDQIVRFDVEYLLPATDGSKDIVTLSPTGVEVVTGNRLTAQRLASHYVSLRPLADAA